MARVESHKVVETLRGNSSFNHQTSRGSWDSFYAPRKEERLSPPGAT